MNPDNNQQPPAPQQTIVVQQAPSNGLGLAGFITSIISVLFTCGLLSPISFLLSIIGLFKRPRGFAIAGSIISVIQLLAIAMIGISPILAVIGFEAAAQKRYDENKTEVLQTLRSTNDRDEINQLARDYIMIDDEEFEKALEAAQKRVPQPGLETSE